MVEATSAPVMATSVVPNYVKNSDKFIKDLCDSFRTKIDLSGVP